MIKIKLNKIFITRYKNYLESSIFKNQVSFSKSIYWEHHSKLITSKIDGNSIILEGNSGNYIPDKKNSLSFFYRKFKEIIKKIIRYNINLNLPYKKAFDEILKENFYLGQKIIFDKKRLIAKNFKECKNIFPFKYELNDHIIRSYYYLNILNSHIKNSENLNVVEIGGGNGNLISLIKHHLKSNCIINIDIPETLMLCIPFLKNLYPDSEMLLPNEIEKKSIDEDTLKKYDFIFITPSQIKQVDKNIIDLFLNTASFQEMTTEQIKVYIDFIQEIGKKNSYFFCTNSVEKIPVDGKFNPDQLLDIKPNRFFEYPFYDNEILLYQLCKFTSLVQNDPAYLRLEKIKK